MSKKRFDKMNQLTRREFLVLSGAVAGTAVVPAIGILGSRNASVKVWTLRDNISSAIPAISSRIDKFIDEVSRETKGEIIIERQASAIDADYNLQHPFEMQVGAPFRWEALIPGSFLFSFVPYGRTLDSYQDWLKKDGLRLWNNLYGQHSELGVFPFGKLSQVKGFWSNKSLALPEDFAGLNMLAFGFSGEVFSQLKANIHFSKEVMNNYKTYFNSRQLDTIQWAGYELEKSAGINTSGAKFYFFGEENADVGASSLEITVKNSSLASLSVENRNKIIHCIQNADIDITSYFKELNRSRYAVGESLSLSIQSAMKQAQVEVFEKVRKMGPFQKEIVDSYLA